MRLDKNHSTGELNDTAQERESAQHLTGEQESGGGLVIKKQSVVDGLLGSGGDAHEGPGSATHLPEAEAGGPISGRAGEAQDQGRLEGGGGGVGGGGGGEEEEGSRGRSGGGGEREREGGHVGERDERAKWGSQELAWVTMVVAAAMEESAHVMVSPKSRPLLLSRFLRSFRGRWNVGADS